MPGECSYSVCDQVSCSNGGVCFANRADGYICLCPLGFRGTLCEESEWILSLAASSRWTLENNKRVESSSENRLEWGFLFLNSIYKYSGRNCMFLINVKNTFLQPALTVTDSPLQISHCPRRSSTRRCFLTPSSPGRSPLAVTCPSLSLRWHSARPRLTGRCSTATTRPAGTFWPSTWWTDTWSSDSTAAPEELR